MGVSPEMSPSLALGQRQTRPARLDPLVMQALALDLQTCATAPGPSSEDNLPPEPDSARRESEPGCRS